MATQQQPQAKRRRLNLSDDIAVILGSESRAFTVPKCFLGKTSDFFKACCNGAWKEATDKKVTLPETDADLFEIYLQWLYTDQLVVSDDDLPTTSNLTDAEQTALIERVCKLVRLAVVADTLQDAFFTNSIVSHILQIKDSTMRMLSLRDIRHVYDNLPPSSVLRRLAIDLYVYGAVDIAWLRDHSPEPHADFLYDLLLAYRTAYCEASIKGVKPQPTFNRRCDYHEHNDKVPRCV